MTAPATSKWRFLPHALVAGWVIYLAAMIWQHALTSVQPPWGDGLSYYQKAASFWRALEQGRFFNPLNLFPSVRPPGTILMSFPFGFSTDFHGFHFRSIFLPLLSIVVAVYIAAGKAALRANGWWVASIAFLFSSLPMFYWLDWNDDRWLNNGWGMVDNFQAGIAALATAALVRSLARKSQLWLLAASSLACLSFLVKQSGLMVMGLLGLTWLIVMAFQWRLAEKAEPARLRAYALVGVLQMFLVYVSVFAVCVLSEYLSGSNFAWGLKALGFYRSVAAPPSLGLFHTAMGEALELWTLAIAALFAFGMRTWGRNGDRAESAPALGLIVSGGIVWIAGLWYWIIVQAGGQQIRYFYPFLLMGAICMVPAALHVGARPAPWIKRILAILCIVPALNIALLLAAGDSPSPLWQKISGVSVSVDYDREEVKQANAFVSEIRKGTKDVRVHFFPNGATPHTFIFVGSYEKLARPELPSYWPVNPMDWSRGFVVRTADMVDSDYVLTRKSHRGKSAERFAAKNYDTFYAETDAFDGWMSTLDAKSGVEIVSDGPLLRVLRIVDRDALSRETARFVAAHAWRPEFTAANRPAPPVWWNADVYAGRAAKSVAEEIRFGDVYTLHALAIERMDTAIRVEAWWEELRHEDVNDQRYLFLHLVDASGAILHNRQIALHPYDPPAGDRRWRYSVETFVDVLPNRKLDSLAFGVYQANRPDGGFLLGDKAGRADWGGKRLLLPLPGTQGSQ